MQAARGASLTPRTGRLPALSFLIGAVALAADQVTKVLAVRHLEGAAPRPVVGELLQLNLAYNPGAAFGLGSGATVVISVLALVAGLVGAYFATRVRTTAWAVALGLVMAGVIGNLVDRLARDPGPLRGHVVDFLQLPHWPIFNVADICINTGAALIVVQFVRGVEIDGSRHG